MSFNAPTPEMIATALRNAPDEYERMHVMNSSHCLIAGCKLGAVFMFQGEYHIYVGVNGRNRKYPCIALRCSDRSYRKMTYGVFEKVRKASQEDA